MLKTITINTETHKVVPIEPTAEMMQPIIYKSIIENIDWTEGVRLAIAAAPEFNKSPWQPIESAPKTSKSILVYNSENKCTYIVSYYIDKYDGSEGWLIFGSHSNKFVSCFSHWMPLPPAPEEQG